GAQERAAGPPAPMQEGGAEPVEHGCGLPVGPRAGALPRDRPEVRPIPGRLQARSPVRHGRHLASPGLPRTAKVPGSLRTIGALAARRNPLGGRVPFGQLEGETEGRLAGALDRQALVVGVSPAAPDVSRCDDIETNEGALPPIVFQYAVDRRGVSEA